MYVIADTRETKKYIKVDMPCANKFKTMQGPQVLLPHVKLMDKTHREDLNLGPLLSKRSKTSHIFPYLQPESLILIGKLRDDVCTAIFTITHTTAEKTGYLVLEVTQKGVSSIWYVHLATTPQPNPHANMSISK